MSSDRPVFLVGCPRSGTTLLALMLHAHPRLAMPPETRFLIRAWRRRHEFGDLRDQAARRALAEDMTRAGSQTRELGLNLADLRDKIVDAPPTLGSALGTVFAEFAKAHGKARWGDKRPGYYVEVENLLRLFPDAQVVHMMRDGRGNVASLKRMPWWLPDSVQSMAHWSRAEYCARRNLRRLPADTFHLVRYETLVTQPRPVLQELCTFLGEEFDEAMLAPQDVAHVIPERKSWHANLRGEVTTSSIDAWRDELEPWEVGLMETVLRRKLRRGDYALSGAGARPSVRLLRQYSYNARRLGALTRQRWKAEAKAAPHERYPVAALLTSGQLATGADPGDPARRGQ